MFVVYELEFKNNGRGGIEHKRIDEFQTLDEANDYMNELMRIRREEKDIYRKYNKNNRIEYSYTIVIE